VQSCDITVRETALRLLCFKGHGSPVKPVK